MGWHGYRKILRRSIIAAIAIAVMLIAGRAPACSSVQVAGLANSAGMVITQSRGAP